MKKFCFVGETAQLKEGMHLLAPILSFEISEAGAKIAVKKSQDGTLSVSNTEICYAEPIHFYRALGLLCEHWNEGEFCIRETPCFDTNGMMLDVCQGNDVMKVEHVKNMLCRMAIMGLNTFYLYMEDSFEVPEEPYFGYLRGRYSEEELREIDRFAEKLGITVIPCIQTLAHLMDALKWYPYAEFKDDDDTLMVGDERSYTFVSHLLQAIVKPFRTKRIHIGMDEAWKLGQGNYLIQNGYRKKYDLMCEHLNRVLAICRDLNIEAMIWSDMFMKAANQNEQPDSDYFQIEGEVPQEMIDSVPRDVDYVFWDYGHHHAETYEGLIDRHRTFTNRLVFAGGIWNWNSFTVDYDKTFITTNAALTACKNRGVREVFATTWGDGGAERNVYSILLGMQLYAEHGYAQDVSEEQLAKRFFACTGCNYADFREMTYLDNLYGQELVDGYNFTNSSRWLMWQDILAGQFDKNIEELGMAKQYEVVYEKMRAATRRNGEYSFVFDFLMKCANVLCIKSEIGIEIKKAYDANDRNGLRFCIDRLHELSGRARALYECHRSLWFEINKPFGWEVLDVRYGGMLMGIDRAIMRLTDYLEGKVTELPEVAAERLYYNGKSGLVRNNFYSQQPSTSRLSMALGW